jgi:type I restriction-modification system DNA methylase subunit
MNINNATLKDLINYYDNTLNKDKTTYKNSNDEPTPINCVIDMVNKIPEEFWDRKEIEILDPCCGNGNFFIPILFKLKKHFSTKDILENILEFNDINQLRLNNVRNVFCEKDYKLQISNDDFIKKEINKKYDLIVANPAYNFL